MTAAMVATAVVAATALLLVATQTVRATLLLLCRDVHNCPGGCTFQEKQRGQTPAAAAAAAAAAAVPSALARVVLGAYCQRAARRHWAERTARRVGLARASSPLGRALTAWSRVCCVMATDAVFHPLQRGPGRRLGRARQRYSCGSWRRPPHGVRRCLPPQLKRKKHKHTLAHIRTLIWACGSFAPAH